MPEVQTHIGVLGRTLGVSTEHKFGRVVGGRPSSFPWHAFRTDKTNTSGAAHNALICRPLTAACEIMPVLTQGRLFET